MQVIHNPDDILRISQDFKCKQKSIGLVPTMGALHTGHLALVDRSVQDNDITIVSVFVNPLQFNNKEDLDNYPRDLESDISQLEKAGVDLVYAPSEADMYPEEPMVSIDFGDLATRLEGQYRPGHFTGVGVVVSKLFHHCNPNKAYFGLKDLQQYLLIRRMVKDLSFQVEVVGLPIVRESSGLAMSSRNNRLSTTGLSIAPKIYEGLQLAREKWENQAGPDETKLAVNDFYSSVAGLEIEYFDIVNPETLCDIDKNHSQPIAFCVAGYVEGIRLIDNLYLRQD